MKTPEPAEKSAQHLPTLYRFGTFEVDLKSGDLRRAGRRVSIQDKPLRALLLLLERAGEVVSRKEIRETLWPQERYGDFEHKVNLTINRLRSTLGDAAGSPRFVETVPRRGYRFIASVQSEARKHGAQPALITATTEATTPGAQPKATSKPIEPTPSNDQPAPSTTKPRPVITRRRAMVALGVVGAAVAVFLLGGLFRATETPPGSIASTTREILLVLPFRDLSPEPTDYLSAGLTSELITRLGYTDPHRLGVIAYTTAERYAASERPIQELAAEVGARYVLEGTLVHADGVLRVQARLILAADQTQALSVSEDLKLDDILAVQRTTAERILAAVTNEVLDSPPLGTGPPETTRTEPLRANPDAYLSYLRGIYLWNQRTADSLRQAIDSFSRSIELDPEFAPAHAGLAATYCLLPSYGVAMPHEAMPAARAAALAALELEPASAEAHMSLAWVQWTYVRDLDAARQGFERAIELNPSLATAHQWKAGLSLAMGQIDAAHDGMRHALALDPMSRIINTGVAWIDLNARLYDRATLQAESVLDRLGTFAYALEVLNLSQAYRGEHAAALRNAERQLQLDPTPAVRANLAYVLALGGARQRAEEILTDLLAETERYVPPFKVAVVHAALGDRDAAFTWLDQAERGHAFEIAFLKVDPRLDPLREDPRFRDLEARLGHTP